MASDYMYTQRCILERRRWVDSLKQKPCLRCGGEFPPYVMDWHHCNPTTKKFSIGSGSFRQSRNAILIEIAKCELYCANCHRIVENEIKCGRGRKV